MKSKTCILFLFTLWLSGCASEQMNSSNDVMTATIQIDHNYEEITDYELFWESIFDVDSTSYYVYFYSTSCNHCEELKNFIVEKALSRGDIYFVKGTSKDQITNDKNKTINAEKPGDIWILGYPTLLKITNYKCSKNVVGISQIKDELK